MSEPADPDGEREIERGRDTLAEVTLTKKHTISKRNKKKKK